MERRSTCWPPLAPSVWLRRPSSHQPFPAQEDGVRLYAFARQGLHHGVRAIGLVPGDEVLVPAYHHGSEVEALVAAGLVPRFYGTGDGIRPEQDELESLLTPAVRALHLTHTFGFPQDPDRWRRWCDQHGLLLIEDAAQAWLTTVGNRPVGSWGDLVVFCAYKTLPLPEGSFVLAKGHELPPPTENDDPGVSDLVRKHGGWLAQRFAPVSRAVQVLGLERVVDPHAELLLRLGHTGPWSTTHALLRRLPTDDVAARRRAHYRLLLEDLDGEVPAAFQELRDGASPFVLPLLVDDKQACLARLHAAQVHALDVWSVPHPLLDTARFPAVKRLRAGVVGLPVHQHLDLPDLRRAVVAARRGRPPRAPRIELLDDVASTAPLWEELAASCPNPFASWEWAAAWNRHHGHRGKPLLAVCRTPDGRPAALLALQHEQVSGVRTLRFWGSPAADLSGPVCAPADDVLAARGLRALLAATPGWQVLLGDRLPTTTSWSALLGASAVRRESSPELPLPVGGWEALLSARSANFRQQVRRRERNVLKAGASFRLSSPATLEGDLRLLFALHALRWPRGSAFAADRPFHEDVARSMMARGRLRLWLLELDGQPVAAWYGFRYAGQDWYYQAGRDPAYDELHVGAVLLAHTVRDAADAGLSAYRFLRGGEAYKARWTAHDPGTQGLVLGRSGGLGRVTAAGLRAAAALPDAPRAAARRVLG